MVHDRLALLVGNAYGDVVTLLYDNATGSFLPDRTDLNNVPLSVTNSNGDVVMANQETDQAFFFAAFPAPPRSNCP